MKIIPGKNIVVCRAAPPEKTKSGLQLPTPEKGAPETGIVYRIGPGKPPVKLTIGAKIVYRRYTDNKVSIGVEEFNFVKMEDILALVK